MSRQTLTAAPAPPMPTALQAYLLTADAIDETARRELPRHVYMSFVDIRRRRLEGEATRYGMRAAA